MDDLKARNRELEKEIEIKDHELDRAHKELLRVNSTLERMISEFTQEIRLAGLIQRALSPTEIPHISGIDFSTKFIPGTKSGGDYFDIFEHEDKLKFGIILACSSGYAMSALFLSVLIKLSAQIEARKGVDPDHVIVMMAQELVPHIQNEDTASIFYGVIDRRTFELRYASVGSIFGALQVQGSDKVQRLEASSGPLIKGYKQKPLTHSVQLGSRDRLLLCTEGVGSWENISQAIHKAPRQGVHELRNEILFQAEQRTGKSEPQRDQTVIVTEIKDRVIKLAKK